MRRSAIFKYYHYYSSTDKEPINERLENKNWGKYWASDEINTKERNTGVEPAFQAWEARALPMC